MNTSSSVEAITEPAGPARGVPSGAWLAARAATPQVGDRYHKPAHMAPTQTGFIHKEASDLEVEGIDREWVTVNLNGKSTRLLLVQWGRLALRTIKHGAQFFPANNKLTDAPNKGPSLER